MPRLPHPSLAAFEVYSFAGALQVLDAVEKAAAVAVLSFELNDNFGLYFLVGGDTASVRTARHTAETFADENRLEIQAATEFSRPSLQLTPLIDAADEPNELLDQNLFTCLIHRPIMANQPNLALGFIETRGFTAVAAAVDAATKAADVNLVAKEKLGGGFITIVLEGDVAAVKAAIDSASEAAAELGEVIAANVIARPSEGVRKILTVLG